MKNASRNHRSISVDTYNVFEELFGTHQADVLIDDYKY